jgi:DNA-binding NarL/FixJ family response regulator
MPQNRAGSPRDASSTIITKSFPGTNALLAGETEQLSRLQEDDTTSAFQHFQLATINVLLVDDHALLREGLRRLLELETDMRIVAEADDGFEALRLVRRARPDVVLMDIHMPVVDGLAVTRQIANEFPTLPVIILTMRHEQQQVIQAISCGAKGYLLKSASSQEVVQAIRIVSQGGVYIEPAMTGAIVNEVRRLSAHAPGGSGLTALSEKEIEILRCVAMGLSNKEIADRLAYAEKTVKNYLSIIFQKLGIRDRTQAAIFALRQGLLPDE